MNAADALKTGRAAGVKVILDGDDLANAAVHLRPRCSMRSPGTRPRSRCCFGRPKTAGRRRSGRSSSTNGPASSSSMTPSSGNAKFAKRFRLFGDE
jgi:hypothetical protein